MPAPSACDVCKGPGNPIGSWPGSIYLDGVQSQCQECYDAEERQADPAYLLTLSQDNRQPIYYPAFLPGDMTPPPEPSIDHIGLPMCRHVYPAPIYDAYIAGKAKGKGKANVKGKGKEVNRAEPISHNAARVIHGRTVHTNISFPLLEENQSPGRLHQHVQMKSKTYVGCRALANLVYGRAAET